MELEEKYEQLLLEIHTSKKECIPKSEIPSRITSRKVDFQSLLDYLINIELVEFDIQDNAYYLTYEGYEKVEEINKRKRLRENVASKEHQHAVKRKKKQRLFVTGLGLFLFAASYFALFGISASQNSIDKIDSKILSDAEQKIHSFQDSILNSKILSYAVNPKNNQLHFYHKDENGNAFGNHGKLKVWLAKQNKDLIFAANGGMYNKDLSPQGLYIENGKEIQEIDLNQEGYGNFYLQPNGIFSITKNNTPRIQVSKDFIVSDKIKNATQSGPMLIIDGDIHPKFTEGSENLHIRNGVGILPNEDLLFAMSKEEINFFDFASFFQKKGCKNALYLDGFVSRTYLPGKDWIQEDGNFAIIIGQRK